MKRWHDDVHAMLRQRKLWRSPFNDGSPRPLGEFRKRHAFDCGNPKCHICHSDKLMKYKRRDEEKAELDMRDQLQELDEIKEEKGDLTQSP